MQTPTSNFTIINTPPWVFFMFFKLYKWYQIAQNITYAWNYAKHRIHGLTKSPFTISLFNRPIPCQCFHLFKGFPVFFNNCWLKSDRIRSFFGLYFPAFGLNTDSDCGKIGNRKTPNRDTFHALYCKILENNETTRSIGMWWLPILNQCSTYILPKMFPGTVEV